MSPWPKSARPLWIASVLLCVSADCFAAPKPTEIEWQQTFGGRGADQATVARQAHGGGYVIAGYSSSLLSGNKTGQDVGGEDFWVVKVDANGAKVWENVFGGGGDDELNDMEVGSDGGYLLGGYSRSCIGGTKTTECHGGYDFWIVKLDASGAAQWDRTYGGLGTDALNSLRQTSDGGYVLGGISDSVISTNKSGTNFGFADYWSVKIDGNGNKMWDVTFGGTNVDVLTCVRQTSDWGFILGGYSNSGLSGNKTAPLYGGFDYWVIKVDSAGVEQAAIRVINSRACSRHPMVDTF